MSRPAPMLLEIGTEELPPGTVGALAEALRANLCAELAVLGIANDIEQSLALWTPRRLTVQLGAVAPTQDDQDVEKRGPAVSAGLDNDGNPTRALIGFAQSNNVPVEMLERTRTDKGEWFVYRTRRVGAPTRDLLPGIVNAALAALPITRPMRWGARDIAFVRPVHWVGLLYGDLHVPGEILGLATGVLTRGHRFHHPEPVRVASSSGYVDLLRNARVLVDARERRARIRKEVEAAANRVGGTARISDALLDEVANLTEWPHAIACTFDRDFLRVPQEALITTMVVNQRFFPVCDAQGRLTEHFVGVANIDSRDPNEIRRGYERVIRPRFADARFFFEEDLKTPLAAHHEALARITFQQRLGSLWDKTLRVAELARTIAGRVGVDAALATHAASLSRSDLATRMVGEFPELQGIMGSHYASAQGQPSEVVQALEDFYAPRASGDGIALTRLGQVLAIADRVDTLAGFFAIGQKPSGSKDPFSLRRTALGLARTLIEGSAPLNLDGLLREAIEQIPGAGIDVRATAIALREFILERLRGYYAEQGIANDRFNAVAAVNPATLIDFDRRLRALDAFARMPEAASLAGANKRIGNLLRKATESAQDRVDPALLADGPELALAAALDTSIAQLGARVTAHDYLGALQVLAPLQQPVDAYFDNVMVMVEDAALRANRLALLALLRRAFLAIADVAELDLTESTSGPSR